MATCQKMLFMAGMNAFFENLSFPPLRPPEHRVTQYNVISEKTTAVQL